VPVIGIGADRAAARHSRYYRRCFTWDADNSDPQRTVEFLLGIARPLGGRAVLIPISDVGSRLVAEQAEALSESYVFPRPPAALVRSLIDKRAMFHLARRLGVATPECVFPTCRADVAAFAERTAFPVVLKGIDGSRLDARTGTRLVVADDARKLLSEYDRLEDAASPNLLLQEYIPGRDEDTWMFNGYFDGRSECKAGFTGRKLRSYPRHTGPTALGICAPNETLNGISRSFMKAAGYSGIVDIDYRFDGRDGLYKVLDVNPRIGATFRLFASPGGLDVARCLYLDQTCQPLPSAALDEGRKWVVEDRYLKCLRYRRDESFSVREWAGALRGVSEAAWFAADDLGPFAAMLAPAALRAIRKALPRP
jgi:predicted ATP-grasp superfamily ATP-dependent carboligase